MAKLLLSRGADPFLRDAAGFNVTFLAREFGHAEFTAAVPNLPAPATVTVEELWAARLERLKKARELAALAEAAKPAKKTKGKKKGVGKKKGKKKK